MNSNVAKRNSDSIQNKYGCEVELYLLVKYCQQIVSKNSIDDINHIIATNEIDWMKLHEYAKQHGILPLLRVTLNSRLEGVPLEIKQRFNKLIKNIQDRNNKVYAEMHRVQKAFDEAGVNITPYKGLPMCMQFYNNIYQRLSVDIDFAIKLEEYPKCKPIMQKLGYTEAKGDLDENSIENSRAYYLDYPWTLEKDGKPLFNTEFHWTPSHNILNIPITFDDFKNQTTKEKITPYTVLTFNKVHQALIAIIHHGSVDCWGKLKHLVDLAKIINVLSDAEMEELMTLCKKFKLVKSFEIGKEFLSEVLDYEVETKEKLPQKWVNDMLHGNLSGRWSENRAKLYFFLISRDSFWDKVKSLYSIIHYQFFIKPKLNIEES